MSHNLFLKEYLSCISKLLVSCSTKTFEQIVILGLDVLYLVLPVLPCVLSQKSLMLPFLLLIISILEEDRKYKCICLKLYQYHFFIWDLSFFTVFFCDNHLFKTFVSTDFVFLVIS